MRIKLVVVDGKLSGKEIAVKTAQFLIGRDETCNLRPASNMVSKLHCALVTADSGVWLRDLKSTNGTFVNGARIAERVQLKDGDELRIGPLTLKVLIEGTPIAAAQKQVAVKDAKPKAARRLDDDDVCDWLSEDEEVIGENDSLNESPTIMDMAVHSETVPDMPELGKPKPPATPKPKSLSREPADKDSSSAASAILQSFFERKRSG